MPVKINHGYHPASRRLLRDERGVTAVEFAMIAPVFLLIISGIIEFAMIMFTTTVMESATNSTSRMGKTGFNPSGVTRQQAIIDSVANRTAGLLNAGLITITSQVYSDFSKIGQPEPCINPINPPCGGTPGVNFNDINGNGTWDSDMGSAGLGNQGDIVVYSVTYPWNIMSPIMRPFLGSVFNITVRSVVRNEPFGTLPGGR
jgi:Flp pilus assembly pilin Flp